MQIWRVQLWKVQPSKAIDIASAALWDKFMSCKRESSWVPILWTQVQSWCCHVRHNFWPSHKCHSAHYRDPCLFIKPHLGKCDVKLCYPSIPRSRELIDVSGTHACTRNVLTQDIHTASPGCKYVPKTHWHNPEIAPAPIGLPMPHWEPELAAHSVSRGRGYFGILPSHLHPWDTCMSRDTQMSPDTHVSLGHTYLHGAHIPPIHRRISRGHLYQFCCHAYW